MAQDIYSLAEQMERYAYTAARFYLMLKRCSGPAEQQWAEETWQEQCPDMPAEVFAQAKEDHKAMIALPQACYAGELQEPEPPDSPS